MFVLFFKGRVGVSSGNQYRRSGPKNNKFKAPRLELRTKQSLNKHHVSLTHVPLPRARKRREVEECWWL